MNPCSVLAECCRLVLSVDSNVMALLCSCHYDRHHYSASLVLFFLFFFYFMILRLFFVSFLSSVYFVSFLSIIGLKDFTVLHF